MDEKTNLNLVKDRIDNLDLKSDIVLAFDFDELIVKKHLSRNVTDPISKPIDENKLSKLGKSSVAGIEYIRSLFEGFDYLSYVKHREKIVSQTPFSFGINDLLIDLNKDYSIIVISSGLKDVAEKKLEEIDFDFKNIIGGELKIHGGIISGSNLIITDELKGYVIEELKKEGRKIISIGHSFGDRYMLEKADYSISYQGEENIADFNIDKIDELREKLLELIDKLK